MGYTTSAYHFYGIRIPEDQWTEAYAGREGERLDSTIHDVAVQLGVRLSHLTAGYYDNHMLFVGIDNNGVSWEVKLGSYRQVGSVQQVPDVWIGALSLLVKSAGYSQMSIDAPGWITVPSVD